MSTNFVSGLVSGVDTTALVDATIQAQSGPLLLLQRRQATETARLSAWKSLEAILVSLKAESDRLGKASLWNSLATSSSDEEALTASATGQTALGEHEIFVVALATANQIRSQDYATRTTEVGQGTLTIGVGGNTTELTVASGTTLEELVDQINTSEAEVTASLVSGRNDDGDPVLHLVLTGTQTGAEEKIDISGTLTGGTSPTFTEVRAAADAHVQYGGEGGLDLYSKTNLFEDIVEGLAITVHAVSEADTSIKVNVSRDTEALAEAVSTFVDRYNTVAAFVNSQFKYDPKVGTRPPLMGEGQLSNVMTGLRSNVTRLIEGTEGATFRTLFAVGIKSDNDGTLSFDSAEFTEALGEDFAAVADLFRPEAHFDVPGVSWISAPDSMSLAGREVEIVVSQAPSRAVVTGNTIDFASGLVIDGTNDAFKISINGNTSELLHLEHKTYTSGDELAAALQEAIEESDDLDQLKANVRFDLSSGSSGVLVISSEREGSDQSLQLLVPSGSLEDDLGFGDVVNETFDGTDAEGTINGETAIGDGATLKIDSDESELDGIAFRVTADSADVPFTTTATFSEGTGRLVSKKLFDLTDASEGVLGRIGKSMESLIQRLAGDIEAKQSLLDVRRQRLLARYARLESTLGQLQSQGQFISAQVGSLAQSTNSLNSR